MPMSKIINLDDLPLHWLKSGSRFEVGVSGVDKPLGLDGLGATLHVVPAGKIAWPFHRHHGQDELFLILAGSGEVRMGDERLPVRAGDLIGAPAGGDAHQIINSSDSELRYFAFSNRTRAEVIEYPDSGKIAVDIVSGNDRDPPRLFSVEGRMTPMSYWDGEDIGETAPTDD